MQEGLALELAGRFHWRQKDLQQALPLLQQAVQVYQKWGGVTKVQHLQRQVDQLALESIQKQH